MGAERNTLFQAKFNRSVRVEAASEPLTEDIGTLLLREVAEHLGLPELIDELVDARTPNRVTFSLRELVLTRPLLIAQGWKDQDDAEALRADPAFRVAVSERGGDRALRARDPVSFARSPCRPRLRSAAGSRGVERTSSKRKPGRVVEMSGT